MWRGVVCVILRLAVSVEHRLVTDRQTDTQYYGTYRANLASRGKKNDWMKNEKNVPSKLSRLAAAGVMAAPSGELD